MDRGEPMKDGDVALSLAAQISSLPVSVVLAIFATHETNELDRILDRQFGGAHDDLLMQSMVTLTNGFAHALERHRRRRGLKPIKLRCTTCQDAR